MGHDIDKTCEFCSKNPSSFDLLQRMLNILSRSRTSDFPKVMQHMAKHIEWKQNP